MSGKKPELKPNLSNFKNRISDLYLRINCSYSDRDKVILEGKHSDGVEENQEDAKRKNMNLPFWSETEEETLASVKWDLLRKK